jgi:acyl-CoA reductase-like NAD-dependent aldehyde dehydrogenase
MTRSSNGWWRAPAPFAWEIRQTPTRISGRSSRPSSAGGSSTTYKSAGVRARRSSAVVTFPPAPASSAGFWVNPTIFVGVRNDMRIAREEIFGPVLSVLKYADLDEAVEIANDTDFGLSAGVWGEDVETALAVAHRLEAGTVWINDWHAINVEYPFGGYKQSGSGRELGPDALDEYTEQKFVHLDVSHRAMRHHALVVPHEAPRS